MNRPRTRVVAACAVLSATLLSADAATAHHGVASLGVAGLAGPGAPLETSSSQTLPRAAWLACVKIDQPTFAAFTPERDGEGDRSTFIMFGLGYGVRPWLSVYAFLPFSAKTVQDNSYNTAGFTDLSFVAVAEASVVGFTEHEYADGARVRFGRETRLNAALVARVLTRPASSPTSWTSGATRRTASARRPPAA